MTIRSMINMAVLILLPAAAIGQISTGQQARLETRLHTLVQKDRSFARKPALTFYHVYHLSYKGPFTKAALAEALHSRKDLQPDSIKVGKTSFVSAESLIVGEQDHLAGGDAGTVLFYDRYSQAYQDEKRELADIFRKNNFSFCFRLSMGNDYPLNIFWAVSGKEIKVIIREQGKHFKLIDAAEFLECCIREYYPQFGDQ